MRPVRRQKPALRWFTLLVALTASGCPAELACKDGKCVPDGAPPATSFETDGPLGSGASNQGPTFNEGVRDSGASGGSAASAPPTATSGAAKPTNGAASEDGSKAGGDSAERAISEADIVQLQGDTLFALSRSAGLAVVDVSQPAALRLLGRYRELPAQPFEMYLQGDIALVMFAGWSSYYALADGSYSYQATSKLVALDVANPSAIHPVGTFDIPGTINDSRIVGDILYVVAHEDGYCWGCEQNKPRTTIVSLNVKDPHAVAKVAERSYDDDDSGWGGQKSITVTTQRMYVAGPEYGVDMPTGSTIQVIDISKPDGSLVPGAEVPVHGMIQSRWQMDEYEGVLRVISQPPTWWTRNGVLTSVPAVQTFAVKSAQEITPIARIDLKLPKPETLRSVRFDGPRAYAITAEQKDPLFTIDLADAAHPRQLAELELPGFIYHMEPRGERLLGLGYDQGNVAGGITVSLFDVKDLAAPKLLSRVNFGGTWASLPEDQDRIHKAFRVLDDKNLITVPVSGWQPLTGDNDCGQGKSVSGVQLVDYQADTLQARGLAESAGQARRALFAHDALLSVGDDRVDAFDISDRSKPKTLSQVKLSNQTQRALQLDNGVVSRIGYADNGQTIDFVANELAGEPNDAYSTFDLSKLDSVNTNACNKGGVQLGQTFVHGSQLEVLYTVYAYDNRGNDLSQFGLLILDTSDPKNPTVVSDTKWRTDQNWYASGGYSYGYYGNQSSVVRTANTITSIETNWQRDFSVVSSDDVYYPKSRLRVLDLRDPKNVKSTFSAVDKDANYSGLIADGETVFTSHFEPGLDKNNPDRGRFYVDRFELANPASPKRLPSVNVPGALMNYFGDSERALVSEQTRINVANQTSTECYTRFGQASWTYPSDGSSSTSGSKGSSSGINVALPPSASGTANTPVVEEPRGLCVGMVQRLHLVHFVGDSAVLEDTLKLGELEQVYSSAQGDGVVFAGISQQNGGGFLSGPGIAVSDCFDCRYGGGGRTSAAALLTLGGFETGKIVSGRLSVEDANNPSGWWGFWGSPQVFAYGKRALLPGQTDVAILDATDPSAPRIYKRVPLIGAVSAVDIRERTALLTLGQQGVQWLSLDQ